MSKRRDGRRTSAVRGEWIMEWENLKRRKGEQPERTGTWGSSAVLADEDHDVGAELEATTTGTALLLHGPDMIWEVAR